MDKKKTIDPIEKANLDFEQININREKIYHGLTKPDNDTELLKQNQKLNKMLEKTGIEVYEFVNKKKKG